MLFELTPKFDSRKSFYGKAKISFEGDRRLLLSYGTPVAFIDFEVHGNRLPVLLDGWDSTQTTLRHAREFLKQNGFKADSKKQMQRDYA